MDTILAIAAVAYVISFIVFELAFDVFEETCNCLCDDIKNIRWKHLIFIIVFFPLVVVILIFAFIFGFLATGFDWLDNKLDKPVFKDGEKHD